MSSLIVTQAALNQTALDWPQNMANIFTAIPVAKAHGSDILFTPELSVTAYEANDNFKRIDNSRLFQALMNIAAVAYAEDPDMIVSVGHPWRLQLREAFERAAPNPDYIKNALYNRLNLPFNVQTLIGGGRILGMWAKTNLYNDGRGFEKRNFAEWSAGDADEYAKLAGIESTFGTIPHVLPDGRTIPFGQPILFVTDNAGNSYVHTIVICETKWAGTRYDGHPNDDSRYDGLNVIPSIARYLGTTEGLLIECADASPPSPLKLDKHRHLNDLASGYADVFVNTDGLGTSGSAFAQDGHRLISQGGRTISSGPRLVFGQMATTTSVIALRQAPEHLREKAHAVFVRRFKAPNAAPSARLAWEVPGSGAEWDNPANPHREAEEWIRNQALWRFDYMRKSGCKGIANALSGGQDSAFNCVTVRVMVELGIHDLGVEGFCDALKLPYKDKVVAAFASGGKKEAVKVCMDHMLTAIYMPTNNSSHETWYAAKTLIEGGVDDQGRRFEGIGGKFMERNVQDLVTMCAMIFGLENSSKMDPERKLKLMMALAEFVHASPYNFTPEQMKDWGVSLQKEYPELKTLTSAALPGHEIGYENFQARIRTVLIWAAANIEGKMPEANPNLDEGYGAYATGAGDLQGGPINPNGGIPKVTEQMLLRHLEQHGLQGVVDRIIALGPVNGNPPSAELQPKKGDQVVQFDEDALQATYAQKAVLARLLHSAEILTDHGQRWLDLGEIYAQARQDPLFKGLDENQLFNSVVNFNQRYEGPAQHKIHFAPLAPSYGMSLDKQGSLRVPNLGGGRRDEVVLLGLELLFRWAREDGIAWDEKTCAVLRERAWQDNDFVNQFCFAIRNKDETVKSMNFNLRGLYHDLKQKGWDQCFTPLAQDHPINIILASADNQSPAP